MANNKVQLADGTTLIDLTSDTVTPQTMVAGTIAHDASGEQIVGTFDIAAIKKGLVYYGTCNTTSDVQIKEVTIDGVTELYTGLHVRILFVNAQHYNGTPMLKLNSFEVKSIRVNSHTDARVYDWCAGEVLDLVYDGTNFVIINNGIATTTYFGMTRLMTSSTNDSVDEALTPAALNRLSEGSISGASAYSSSSTYVVGDRVRQGSYMYECITQITTPEAWNSSHWQRLDPLLTQIDNVRDSIPIAGTNLPLRISGNGVIGNSKSFARADHQHPVDTYVPRTSEIVSQSPIKDVQYLTCNVVNRLCFFSCKFTLNGVPAGQANFFTKLPKPLSEVIVIGNSITDRKTFRMRLTTSGDLTNFYTSSAGASEQIEVSFVYILDFSEVT